MAFGLLTNDYATLGGLQLTAYTQPIHGTVTAAGNGSFTYTPSPGFSGVDTFTYTAGAGILSSTATVTIDVYQPLLVATPDAFTALAGKTLVVAGVNGLLGNDYTNSGTIDATSFSSPSHGMLSVSLTGDITYTPNPGFIGIDTFTYYISNGYGTAFAVDTIDVVHAPPVANTDDYAVKAGRTLLVNPVTGVLANDFALGGTVVATSFSSPSRGMLSVSIDGSFTYVPDAGFVGTDSFTYHISDGTQTALAVADINVWDAAPVANLDYYHAAANSTLVVNALNGLLANDFTNGGTIVATSFSPPSHGMLSVSIDGSFTYVPSAGFAGTDSFTYYISDGSQTSYAVADIAVAPRGVVANPDVYSDYAGQTLTVNAANGILLNDFANFGTVVATSFSSPSHGMLSVSIDGSFTYVPTAGFIGTDTFTYYISNGTGTSFAVDTIDVYKPLVVASPETYAVQAGRTLTVTGGRGLLGNDYANTGTVVATSFSSPSHGMLSVSLTGDITYVPDPGFFGTNTFTYYISNGLGTTFAVDTIDVVAAPPVAGNDFYTVHAGSTLLVDPATGLLANDIAFAGTVDATSFSSPSHGMLSVSIDGSFTYVPKAGFVGTDSFTYYISDGTETSSATASIDVVDTPPVANPDFYYVGENGELLVTGARNLLGNDFANGGTIVATSFSSASHGMLSVSLTGDITYTPFSNYVGADSFTYHISNGTETSYAVATIEVIACFAAGTHILTDRGEVPVEALGIGDRMVTHDAGIQPIKWIGRRHCTRAQIARNPDLGPVRICKGALSPNVPHRDLLVSSDHALYLGNVLIQARLLVNGATVSRELPQRPITYYHIELASHAIVLAEGLAAETYLDTGNRDAFDTGAMPLVLHPEFGGATANDARQAASCAPFALDAAVTEPLWRQIAERAASLGYALPTTVFTADPGLRLLAGTRSLTPCVSGSTAYVFAVPRSCRMIRLISRAAAPHLGRPWLDDRRVLGVPVGRIVISDGTGTAEIAVDHPSLTDGWHAAERVGSRLWRWTDGNALLPLPDGARLIEIQLAGAADYPVEVASGASIGIAETASAVRTHLRITEASA